MKLIRLAKKPLSNVIRAITGFIRMQTATIHIVRTVAETIIKDMSRRMRMLTGKGEVKVEFIESYIKHGAGDYQWNDNHGELVRCKNCKYWVGGGIDDRDNFIPPKCTRYNEPKHADWFCADAERK